jgi:hypothetical protein
MPRFTLAYYVGTGRRGELLAGSAGSTEIEVELAHRQDVDNLLEVLKIRRDSERHRPDSTVLCVTPCGIEHGQRFHQLSSRSDAELREDLAQVPLDGARA